MYEILAILILLIICAIGIFLWWNLYAIIADNEEFWRILAIEKYFLINPNNISIDERNKKLIRFHNVRIISQLLSAFLLFAVTGFGYYSIFSSTNFFGLAEELNYDAIYGVSFVMGAHTTYAISLIYSKAMKLRNNLENEKCNLQKQIYIEKYKSIPNGNEIATARLNELRTKMLNSSYKKEIIIEIEALERAFDSLHWSRDS